MVVRTFGRPQEISGEDLAASSPFLRRQNGGHLASDRVAHELPRGRIEPADDPMSVDHVGGDADAVKRAFDIAAEHLQTGHGTEFARPKIQASTGRRGQLTRPVIGLRPQPRSAGLRLRPPDRAETTAPAIDWTGEFRSRRSN